ncbi:ribonuclease H-like domain-containing protein [Tanacetum coccineum]
MVFPLLFWQLKLLEFGRSTVTFLWLKKVILNGDGPIQTTKDENGVETEVPPKTAQAILTRQRERKDKSIFLLAIPDAYQLRFHAIKDANTLWAAIKSWFGGNVESKKMQKNNVAFLFAEDTSSSSKVNTANGVVMLSMRVKQFYKNTGRKLNFNGKEPIGFDKTKVECFNYHRRGHFARECRAPRNQGNRNGDARYRSRTAREVTVETLMHWSLRPSGSDTEIIVPLENNVDMKKRIAVLEFDVKDKDNVITRLKNQLDETLREKDDLKAKLEQFETSSKNLNKLINSQLSTKNKTGLGYGDQMYENDSSGSEVFDSVFDSRSSDEDDNQTNDRPLANKTSASMSKVAASVS